MVKFTSSQLKCFRVTLADAECNNINMAFAPTFPQAQQAQISVSVV